MILLKRQLSRHLGERVDEQWINEETELTDEMLEGIENGVIGAVVPHDLQHPEQTKDSGMMREVFDCFRFIYR